MSNVSPGVFTTITDLSTYVQAVPSTIGFVCGLTKKGRDNELIFVGSNSDFISEWGEPDISIYAKNYGQGPYIAYNHLGQSGALYWMRCMSEDATYANIRIDSQLAEADATTSIILSYVDSLNTVADLQTQLDTTGNLKPIAFLVPIGRGDYYNAIGVRFTVHSNPTLTGVYVLDIYEKQSNGEEVIIESFDVSFDPNAVDSAGDSIFITNILATYSSTLRCYMTLADGTYTDGYALVAKVYDNDIGTVSVDLAAGEASITDNKQDFTDWDTDPATGNAAYVVQAKDGKGNSIWGWLGATSGVDGETITVYPERMLTGATPGWNGAVSNFNPSSTITYEIKASNASIATAFTSAEPVPLRKGSDGSLLNSDGSVNTTEATTLLEQGYSGLLTNPITSVVEDSVLDTETVYFTLVYDAGYPTDIKTAITTLCQTRDDCVAILDNGDNSTVDLAITARTTNNIYNTFYAAIYEGYSKVADPFTGNDVWFSPVYHMSYLIPQNDNVAELWFAVAGFQRGAINSIEELRYNPRLTQRDQLYLNQLNPIVKFSAGYVVWGQLTSQSRASALQNLNVVRMVLYCKKALSQYCQGYIFEQNDQITWTAIATNIVDFLDVIKKKRGLDSYSIDVGATDYELKMKQIHVNVTLTPTEVAEQIYLNFFIK